MTMRIRLTVIALLAALGLAHLSAQPPRPAAPKLSPREAAPIDLTGYWVSVVSEDWRWRMVTPAKGDFASIPFTPEGKRWERRGIQRGTNPRATSAKLTEPPRSCVC